MEPHLDSSQIEELLRASANKKEDSANDQVDANARIHLKDCSLCQARVRAEGKAMERLAQLKSGKTGTPSPQCPPDSVWLELAARIRPSPERLLRHAAQCDHCGALLRDAVEDLTGECTPQEEAQIAGLASATPKWQKDLARSLITGARGSAPADPRPHPLRFWPLYAVAAVVLIILSTWGVLYRSPTHSTQLLLADAYSEHRTLELRIPGAKQAPVRLERGAGLSNLDKPRSLLRAESIIAEHLRKNPNDVEFLDAKARADLIDGNFDSAIKTLQRAMETQPISPVLMTDLATAYFARAEATGQAIDYGRAIDNLGKVLAASPHDSLALFNRAIAEERMFLYDDAVADWEQFLKVEMDPAWREEGRQRLEELSHRIEERKRSTLMPSHDPLAAIADLSGRGRSTEEKARPPTFDEDYLKVAITEWLPVVSSRSDQSSAARKALEALSQQFRRRHHDDWLADLIRGPDSPAWAEGSRELAAAFRADAAGNIGAMVLHAAKSVSLFHLAGNLAGEAGAQLQYASGLNRSERGHDCLAAANSALQQTHNHRYPWIETAVLYELSTCDLLNGNPPAATESAHRAQALTETAQYPVLELDGLNYLDGVTTSGVASSESWNRIRADLRVFWEGHYPPLSGANFYLDLGYAAETKEMYRMAERAGRETVLMNSLAGDRIQQAAAHHWLAQVAEAAGESSLAAAESADASTVLEKSGTDFRAAAITLEIERAALEVRQGKFALAATRLDAIEPSLAGFSKQYSTMLYLEAAGCTPHLPW